MKRNGASLIKTIGQPSGSAHTAIPIVGIGASAGGLEAFTSLLKGLPSSTGMAFVFVQHMEAAHGSLLPELLHNVSSMPVVKATERMPIAANQVYIAPSNALLSFEAGVLHLTPRQPGSSPHLSIDSFFESLARTAESSAIGVVLSGTGFDGSRGLQAIKAAGGITLAQDEITAQSPEMPNNARLTGCVDISLTPRGIAEELVRIAAHPYFQHEIGQPSEEPASMESDAAFLNICLLLGSVSGVDLHLYKEATLLRRIQRRIALGKHTDLSEYLAYLRENRPELNALMQDVFIHVTAFFRDAESMQVLQQNILRELINAQQPP